MKTLDYHSGSVDSLTLFPEHFKPSKYVLFPYYGNKKKITSTIWEKIGPHQTVIEPFAGSMAFTLANPYPTKEEIANDANGLIINIFRAIKLDVDTVLDYLDNEMCLHELTINGDMLRVMNVVDHLERLMVDETYCDPILAAKTIVLYNMVLGARIGIKNTGPWRLDKDKLIYNRGQGIAMSKMQMDKSGILLGNKEQKRDVLYSLANRLKDVILMCGDWKRLIPKYIITDNNDRVLFLDPPYCVDSKDEKMEHELYTNIGHVHNEVLELLGRIEKDGNSHMTVVLCGYEGEYDLDPNIWKQMSWKKSIGRESVCIANGKERKQSFNETVWIKHKCK